MKSGQRKNHKGLKIALAIVGGLVALSLISQLWLLYILVGSIIVAVQLGKRIAPGNNKTPAGTPSYWQKRKSQKPLIALTVICPPAGLVIISQYRKAWAGRAKIAIPVVSWTLAWFLLLGFATHIPAEYTPPTYKSNVSTINLDIYSSDVRTSETSIPSSTKDIESIDSSNRVKPAEGSSSDSSSQSATDGDVMSGITMANPESVPYDRKQYQPNWSVGGGCDIRSRILTATSTLAVSYGANGCTVNNGSWNDPYTGQVLAGNPYRGDDSTANDLDIDHIIPLNYVNSHGGYHWTPSKKREYGASLSAMNSGVYLAVSASENRRKSDNGPSSYYPPNQSYRCTYSEQWRNTARTYNISLSPADYRLIASVLVGCGVK